jgi:deoxyribodipyrimidine photolyase-related protein
MFLSSRGDFKEYLQTNKKPFMANFYKIQRIKFNILMKSKNEPLGGKWSFDEDNRNKLDPKVTIPKHITFKQTTHTENVKKFLEKNFLDHPGEIESFNFPTTRKDTLNLYFDFLKNKLNLFGDFEDAISHKSHILFHSMLSPLINLGLLTPEQIVSETLAYAKTNKVKLNCLEGYLRQIIGWREFMRGIYQNYESKLENTNFFKHNKKLTKSWYEGTTGIDPLDHTIKNCIQYGWSHHIERLMVVANIMNLSGIDPKSVYRWFMEMYVDSSDWVMAPNVYGMGLFSDGGIFATKPYICASSYLLKMSDFKRGDWCDTLDGLYWQFIEKNKVFFGKNYRLSMMVKILEKMDKDKKKRIYSAADNFIKRNTN